MNYKNINRGLLKRYEKVLNNKLQNLKCKDIGEYFGGSKFTRQDKIRYSIIQNKINKIRKLVY